MTSSRKKPSKPASHAKDTPLRRVRKRKGLTLDDLAAVLGCHNSTMSRIDSGKRVATPDQAARLKKYLGRGISELQILYPERYTA